MSARQELQPSRNGEANNLIEALQTSDKIAQANTEDIVKVLRLAMVKVGLRANNLPSKEETAVLLDHIRTHYAGNTVAEIRLAFEMAITGKLDLKPEDVKTFENFTCAYFSTIMNAYRAWSAVEYRQAIKPEMMEQKVLTDEQLENIHREDIENFYQRLRGGWVPDKMPKYFEERLQKDGLLKEGENLNDFFVRKLGANAECLYRKDI